MKYLKQELYEKAVYGDEFDKWDEMYQISLAELEKISSRLPKLFLKEFYKYHFHDNLLISLTIERVGYRHALKMELSEYHDERIIHSLEFTDVSNFKSSLELRNMREDWIYCEILPVDEKRTSLEIAFPDDMMYFEFSKMHYKKIKLTLADAAKQKFIP